MSRALRWGRRAGWTFGFLATGAAMLFALLEALFPFPVTDLHPDPSSPRVTSREGIPLLAAVADDDQWRRPVTLEAIDPRLIAATIAVEDERFHRHTGVDPPAILRAVGQNIFAGKIVSGASTITMQLCRLLEPRPRTFRSKAIEAFRALELERVLTKEEILTEYLNRAPYGGNLVGVEAAARHYFGKSADALSLAECALLAGIPQGPAILRPDRHPQRAKRRREKVLDRMAAEGVISEEEARRAANEPIDVRPLDSAGLGPAVGERDLAPHAAWWAVLQEPSGGVTTIDARMQRALLSVIDESVPPPVGSEVAAVIIEVETGAIRALVGSQRFGEPAQGWVNGATSPRSPGSALKPFLYATAFASGRVGPDSILPDRPIERGGWRPQNFRGEWRGSVTAAEALRDSLNVPAIRLAEALGVTRVTRTIERCGVRLPPDPGGRGGLAVVTGSLEVTLVDLVEGVATLARLGVPRPATIWESEGNRERATESPVLPAFACLEVEEILRVGGAYAGDPWWTAKTGTSARHRDAWAVGWNRRFAIGVWVGRLSGGGDPALVGAEVARPILDRAMATAPFADRSPPRSAAPRAVSDPFTFREENERLRIEMPPADAEWLVDGDERIDLRPVATGGAPPYHWFLNGAPIDGERLTLPLGISELRCVDADGSAVERRLSVRAAAATSVR